MAEYICIGAPYYIGEREIDRTEVQAVEKSGIVEEIGASWLTIEPDFNSARNKITAVNRAIAAAIQDNANKIPLIFTSDCCSALGVIKGLADQQPGVIWFDAHGDFNTEHTSPSGFLGGMPLAWLTGRGDQKYMHGLDLDPVPDSRVILTDARDLDPGEQENLNNSTVKHLTDVEKLLADPLAHAPYYIHFDTDVVALDDMPGMNYPTPGGPSLETCMNTLQFVTERTKICGILFSLWNDTLPTDGKALASTLALVRAFVEANEKAN